MVLEEELFGGSGRVKLGSSQEGKGSWSSSTPVGCTLWLESLPELNPGRDS
jgi:hypothetical protein